MILTIDQILLWGPCYEYETEELILDVSGGRREMELLDILDLDIPIQDRIWVGIQALPISLMIEYACDCAWQVLNIHESQYPGDRRPRAAIELARMYNDGWFDGELNAAESASWAAARAADADWAARAAAWASARAAWASAGASRAAAGAAAGASWAAAWASAGAAAEKWQLGRLKHYARMV